MTKSRLIGLPNENKYREFHDKVEACIITIFYILGEYPSSLFFYMKTTFQKLGPFASSGVAESDGMFSEGTVRES
jgi:hypothetical protein